MNNKTVRVYDTINKKYVDVEVSDEVYTFYMKTKWDVENNNSSFYRHQLQFSMLIGGQEGGLENFKEFSRLSSDEHDLDIVHLHGCLDKLKRSE